MPALDVAYINPFIRAVDGLMSTMINVPATLRQPRLLSSEAGIGSHLTIGVRVDLFGTTQGMVLVAFSRPVATALASALAGTEMRTIDDDCRDALGEIGNLLVGQAKTLLPGGATRMSVPAVVDTIGVEFSDKHPVLLVPFDTAVGPFMIAVACHGATLPAAAATAAA